MTRPPFNPDRKRGAEHARLSDELEAIGKRTIGAATGVPRELGPGFPERVYERAMLIALEEAGLQAQRQFPFAVTFHGKPVGRGYVDILTEGRVIVELKSVEAVSAVHVSQATGYLRAMKLRLAYVMNFHVPAWLTESPAWFSEVKGCSS